MEQNSYANDVKREAERIIELSSLRDRREEIIVRLNEALLGLDHLLAEDQAA